MYIFITVALYRANWLTVGQCLLSFRGIVGSYVGSRPIGGIDCSPRQSKLWGIFFH